jgi:2-polyprenyl-6-hydroxyphenyl methylase/3-demethylubiquinone-9 3-methyltransferase
MQDASFSAEEVARFDALAGRWWDPSGPMRALHRMNPARIGWIDERIARRFPDPAGLRVLDLGCGAGLAAEALARRGYTVLGLDAAGEAIEAGRAHAADSGLRLDYRAGAAEDLVAEGRRFPVVTALEVIEHVPDQQAFVTLLSQLLEPGGLLFLSTMSRTPQSFVAAKVAAEYVLRWLPVGTHDWRKFVTPTELARMVRAAGLRVTDVAGITPDLMRGGWKTVRDLSVNYLAVAEAER